MDELENDSLSLLLLLEDQLQPFVLEYLNELDCSELLFFLLECDYLRFQSSSSFNQLYTIDNLSASSVNGDIWRGFRFLQQLEAKLIKKHHNELKSSMDKTLQTQKVEKPERINLNRVKSYSFTSSSSNNKPLNLSTFHKLLSENDNEKIKRLLSSEIPLWCVYGTLCDSIWKYLLSQIRRINESPQWNSLHKLLKKFLYNLLLDYHLHLIFSSSSYLLNDLNSFVIYHPSTANHQEHISEIDNTPKSVNFSTSTSSFYTSMPVPISSQALTNTNLNISLSIPPPQTPSVVSNPPPSPVNNTSYLFHTKNMNILQNFLYHYNFQSYPFLLTYHQNFFSSSIINKLKSINLPIEFKNSSNIFHEYNYLFTSNKKDFKKFEDEEKFSDDPSTFSSNSNTFSSSPSSFFNSSLFSYFFDPASLLPNPYWVLMDDNRIYVEKFLITKPNELNSLKCWAYIRKILLNLLSISSSVKKVSSTSTSISLNSTPNNKNLFKMFKNKFYNKSSDNENSSKSSDENYTMIHKYNNDFHAFSILLEGLRIISRLYFQLNSSSSSLNFDPYNSSSKQTEILTGINNEIVYKIIILLDECNLIKSENLIKINQSSSANASSFSSIIEETFLLNKLNQMEYLIFLLYEQLLNFIIQNILPSFYESYEYIVLITSLLSINHLTNINKNYNDLNYLIKYNSKENLHKKIYYLLKSKEIFFYNLYNSDSILEINNDQICINSFSNSSNENFSSSDFNNDNQNYAPLLEKFFLLNSNEINDLYDTMINLYDDETNFIINNQDLYSNINEIKYYIHNIINNYKQDEEILNNYHILKLKYTILETNYNNFKYFFLNPLYNYSKKIFLFYEKINKKNYLHWLNPLSQGNLLLYYGQLEKDDDMMQDNLKSHNPDSFNDIDIYCDKLEEDKHKEEEIIHEINDILNKNSQYMQEFNSDHEMEVENTDKQIFQFFTKLNCLSKPPITIIHLDYPNTPLIWATKDYLPSNKLDNLSMNDPYQPLSNHSPFKDFNNLTPKFSNISGVNSFVNINANSNYSINTNDFLPNDEINEKKIITNSDNECSDDGSDIEVVSENDNLDDLLAIPSKSLSISSQTSTKSKIPKPNSHLLKKNLSKLSLLSINTSSADNSPSIQNDNQYQNIKSSSLPSKPSLLYPYERNWTYQEYIPLDSTIIDNNLILNPSFSNISPFNSDGNFESPHISPLSSSSSSSSLLTLNHSPLVLLVMKILKDLSLVNNVDVENFSFLDSQTISTIISSNDLLDLFKIIYSSNNEENEKFIDDSYLYNTFQVQIKIQSIPQNQKIYLDPKVKSSNPHFTPQSSISFSNKKENQNTKNILSHISLIFVPYQLPNLTCSLCEKKILKKKMMKKNRGINQKNNLYYMEEEEIDDIEINDYNNDSENEEFAEKERKENCIYPLDFSSSICNKKNHKHFNHFYHSSFSHIIKQIESTCSFCQNSSHIFSISSNQFSSNENFYNSKKNFFDTKLKIPSLYKQDFFYEIYKMILIYYFTVEYHEKKIKNIDLLDYIKSHILISSKESIYDIYFTNYPLSKLSLKISTMSNLKKDDILNKIENLNDDDSFIRKMLDKYFNINKIINLKNLNLKTIMSTWSLTKLFGICDFSLVSVASSVSMRLLLNIIFLLFQGNSACDISQTNSLLFSPSYASVNNSSTNKENSFINNFNNVILISENATLLERIILLILRVFSPFKLSLTHNIYFINHYQKLLNFFNLKYSKEDIIFNNDQKIYSSLFDETENPIRDPAISLTAEEIEILQNDNISWCHKTSIPFSKSLPLPQHKISNLSSSSSSCSEPNSPSTSSNLCNNNNNNKNTNRSSSKVISNKFYPKIDSSKGNIILLNYSAYNQLKKKYNSGEIIDNDDSNFFSSSDPQQNFYLHNCHFFDIDSSTKLNFFLHKAEKYSNSHSTESTTSGSSSSECDNIDNNLSNFTSSFFNLSNSSYYLSSKFSQFFELNNNFNNLRDSFYKQIELIQNHQNLLHKIYTKLYEKFNVEGVCNGVGYNNEKSSIENEFNRNVSYKLFDFEELLKIINIKEDLHELNTFNINEKNEIKNEEKDLDIILSYNNLKNILKKINKKLKIINILKIKKIIESNSSFEYIFHSFWSTLFIQNIPYSIKYFQDTKIILFNIQKFCNYFLFSNYLLKNNKNTNKIYNNFYYVKKNSLNLFCNYQNNTSTSSTSSSITSSDIFTSPPPLHTFSANQHCIPLFNSTINFNNFNYFSNSPSNFDYTILNYLESLSFEEFLQIIEYFFYINLSDHPFYDNVSAYSSYKLNENLKFFNFLFQHPLLLSLFRSFLFDLNHLSHLLSRHALILNKKRF